jgi:hypothetical protein
MTMSGMLEGAVVRPSHSALRELGASAFLHLAGLRLLGGEGALRLLDIEQLVHANREYRSEYQNELKPFEHPLFHLDLLQF